MNYEGYKLVDKVVIVAKDVEDDYLPAFVADPLNKSQLKNAKDWARYTEWGPYNEELNKREWSKKVEGLQFEFDNSSFRLSLLDCAGYSSQGGKLSFWNCIIEKENKKFKVGINTNLLLDVLKEGTFEKGVCKEPVCFVSKNGQTGVCIENGEIYNHAKKDMKLKDYLKKSQTTKYKYGDHVCTATLDEIYLGKMYKYYDVISNKDYRWGGGKYTIKVIKLKNPKPVHIFAKANITNSILEIFDKSYLFHVRDSMPKRTINNDAPIYIDLTIEEFNKKFYSRYSVFDNFSSTNDFYKNEESTLVEMLVSSKFGVSDSFREIDSHTRELMNKYKFTYFEE